LGDLQESRPGLIWKYQLVKHKHKLAVAVAVCPNLALLIPLFKGFDVPTKIPKLPR